jgi:hypothetical protein
VLAAAAIGLGSTTAAAYAGMLPSPIQNIAHHMIGAPPAHRTGHPKPGKTPLATPQPAQSATAKPATSAKSQATQPTRSAKPAKTGKPVKTAKPAKPASLSRRLSPRNPASRPSSSRRQAMTEASPNGLRTGSPAWPPAARTRSTTAAMSGEEAAGRRQHTADVTSVMYNPDFAALDIRHPRATLVLSEAFGGTQGLDISGSGYRENGTYTGTITYVIRDIYGFYAKSKFLGVGPKMHYLQGICGAPWYKHGAHWFPDSVTVTIPFEQSAS